MRDRVLGVLDAVERRRESDAGAPRGSRPGLEDLLYAGETVVETVGVDDGDLVVTSHRVLAYTPEGDGSTLRAADRPNVEDVSLEREGWSRPLGPALRGFVVGVVCLGAGLTVSFDGMLADVAVGDAGAAVGIGGLVSLLATIQRLLAVLDDLLVAVGVLGLLVGVGGLGVWLRSREDVVVVAVEGGGDLVVSAATASEAAVGRVRDAVRYG